MEKLEHISGLSEDAAKEMLLSRLDEALTHEKAMRITAFETQTKEDCDKLAQELEKLLEDGINSIGLGPQGLKGLKSVMGVNVVNTARHPSTIGVAVNTGCWSHRRGLIVIDRDLNYTMPTHQGVTL